MHSIDLKKFNIRTDLLVDEIELNKKDMSDFIKTTKYDNISVEEVLIDEVNNKIFNKKNGYYKTINFLDITDKDNYNKVEKVFIEVLKDLLKDLNIDKNNSCLIIGLGNDKSTPDSLGPKVIDGILVTNHLFKLGDVEEGYRKTASFKPSVTGLTGIETKDIIESLVEKTKPDFLIIIDSLSSSNLDRLNKTIQLTSAGISPGSGIGNNRVEISRDTLNIPVIAIGIPTVVDATTIVNDTFLYLFKQLSFNIDNIDNNKIKLVPTTNLDYSHHKNTLTKEEKEKLLGYVGTLNELEFKELIYEVLTPINSNLIVTPTEIDFVIEKLALLISSGINKCLHKKFNPTK
ncbi:MAG: GPR endopeptidase [Bacilli bacterium]|nr:GPR endopeptidase [Bacilli bacterium]